MKKNISVIMTIVFCLMAFMPVSVSAKTYKLSDTDITIDVDDTLWYVFTRDNIKDNPELDELEISYDSMYDTLYDNNAYMNAALFYEDGAYIELFVRKNVEDSGVVNLSNYEGKEVSDLAKEVAKKKGIDTYSVYENQYKFVKLEFKDSDYYICEYITIVNKDIYDVTFQAPMQFNDDEKAKMKEIVDSVRFDVDASLKEKGKALTWKGALKNALDNVAVKTVIGGIIGGIVGFVIAMINKKKKKNAETNTEHSNIMDIK